MSQPSRTGSGIAWKFRRHLLKRQKGEDRLRIVRKFFVSYVLVLFVPILLSAAIYRESILLAEQSTEQDVENVVTRVGNLVNHRMAEVGRLVGLLSQNPVLRHFQYLFDDEVREDFFRLVSLKNSLFPYAGINDLGSYYTVAFAANAFVTSRGSAGMLAEYDQPRFASHFGGCDEFRAWLFDRVNL